MTKIQPFFTFRSEQNLDMKHAYYTPICHMWLNFINETEFIHHFFLLLKIFKGTWTAEFIPKVFIIPVQHVP